MGIFSEKISLLLYHWEPVRKIHLIRGDTLGPSIQAAFRVSLCPSRQKILYRPLLKEDTKKVVVRN